MVSISIILLNVVALAANFVLTVSNDESINNNIRRLHEEAGIIGGTDAPPGKYPWYTQLYRKGSFTCGGSLIHPDIILTAAHCGKIDRAYVAGQTVEDKEGEEFDVTDRARHPCWQGLLEVLLEDDPDFDYQVLKLERPSTEVTPIPLNNLSSIPLDGATLEVMGFGATTSNHPLPPMDFPDQLQEFSTTAVNQSTCSEQYADVNLFNDDIISENMVCYGGNRGEGVCSGDSGGPVVDISTGTQVGINSFVPGYVSPKCGDGEAPDVGARVSAQIDWIHEQICELSDSPPDYCTNSPSPITFNCPAFNPCFSPLGEVVVEGKGNTYIKDIVVGEKVLTKSGQFKTVFTIDHRHPTRPTLFRKIRLEGGDSLEITPNHMLFVGDKLHPIPSSQVRVGDTVQTPFGGPKKIVSVSNIVQRGLYNPITSDGTIVVNGVLASSYSSYTGTSHIEIGGFKLFSFHTIADMAYAPYSAFCTHVSLELCNQHDELSPLNKSMRALYDFWSKQCGVVKLVVLFAYVILICFFNLMTKMITSCSALTILLIIFGWIAKLFCGYIK